MALDWIDYPDDVYDEFYDFDGNNKINGSDVIFLRYIMLNQY